MLETKFHIIYPIMAVIFNVWNIYIYLSKVGNCSRGWSKASLLLATTLKCWGEHDSFPWIAPFYPWSVSYNVLSKTASSTIFLCLWYYFFHFCTFSYSWIHFQFSQIYIYRYMIPLVHLHVTLIHVLLTAKWDISIIQSIGILFYIDATFILYRCYFLFYIDATFSDQTLYCVYIFFLYFKIPTKKCNLLFGGPSP